MKMIFKKINKNLSSVSFSLFLPVSSIALNTKASYLFRSDGWINFCLTEKGTFASNKLSKCSAFQDKYHSLLKLDNLFFLLKKLINMLFLNDLIYKLA